MSSATDPVHISAVMPELTAAMARDVANRHGVCIRPLIRRVLDRETGSGTRVAIRCGSTRASVCPGCADSARRLRIQQCASGWHRDSEPEVEPSALSCKDEDSAATDGRGDSGDASRRVRSTVRRADIPDLPRVPMASGTIGRTFVTPDGRTYRPSMFVTLTLPSYGKVHRGVPVDASTYDYRRAALDAIVFPRLLDRFWQNLRRVAGFKVQYFSAIEPQHRLAPHLHAAIRGSIPRVTLRQVVAATYVQIWWPPFRTPVYTNLLPRWDGTDYVDSLSGEVLPTWTEALDEVQRDPEAKPSHVARFGRQLDIAGIIAPSEDADRAIRYLTKYLTKSIANAHVAEDAEDLAYEAHIDRLHDELRWLPCGERCANWLRYGVQPHDAGPGLVPGRCPGKAHDRENLGLGGRRVLVSRQWSGKTLSQHKADRAAVVREALEAAGMVGPEIERLAADVVAADGKPRYLWSEERPDPITYARVLMAAIAERLRWKTQYQLAKDRIAAVDNRSATSGPAPPDLVEHADPQPEPIP